MAGGEVALRRLHHGPVPLAADWLQFVNESQTEAELEAMRPNALQWRLQYGRVIAKAGEVDGIQRIG